MLPRFQIQTSREVSVVTQLVSQLSFAIANGQLAPGEQLPSLRQLAQQTGLHRNTIARVYQQLADQGLIESREGSGVYVRLEGGIPASIATTTLHQCLNTLTQQGYSYSQIRELFLAMLEWRIQCNQHLCIVVPQRDLGIGEVMRHELTPILPFPLTVVPLEELGSHVTTTPALTVITSRYFWHTVQSLASPLGVRVIPLDINPFTEELQVIQSLPAHTCLGIVCRSPGLLQAAQGVLEGLRGEDLLVLTAHVTDDYQMRSVAMRARVIFVDATSWDAMQRVMASLGSQVWPPPQILCCQNYLHAESVAALQQELRLTADLPTSSES